MRDGRRSRSGSDERRRRATCASASGACPGMERLLPALEGLPPAYLVGGAVRDLLRGATATRHRHRRRGRRALGCASASRNAWAAMRASTSASARRRVETASTHFNLADHADGDLRRARRAAAGGAGAARRRPAPARLHDQRDGGRAHRRRPRAPLRPHGRARRPGRRPRSACSTNAASSTTRRACCERCATPRGSASRSTRRPSALAREAAAADALSTVSGARIRDELMDLLGELDAPAGIERMRDLEIHTALHPELDPDPDLVASAALGATAIGADRAIAALAALAEERSREARPVAGRPAPRRATSATRPRARRAWRRRSRRRSASASTRPRSCARCSAGSRSRRWRSRWRWARRRSRSCAG